MNPFAVRRNRRLPSDLQISCGLLLLALVPLSGFATEGGATAFPNGGEDFLVAAMPPPGWYGIVYLNRYTADRLADGAGHMPVERFDLVVNAVTPRLDWVKPASLFGSDRWGTLVVLPLLDLDLRLSPAPGVDLHGAKRGPGDLTIGNGLHWGFKNYEMVNAIDAVFPTGEYDQHDLVNPGRNQWVLRVNHMGTWFPSPTWDISYRLHWDRNFRNPATGYLSGQTIYLNWAAGWKPIPTTTIGLVGYFLRQLTDDDPGGAPRPVDGNRLRSAGIGPVVKHVGPHGVMYTVKYLRDFAVRNRPVGSQVWFYAAFRF